MVDVGQLSPFTVRSQSFGGIPPPCAGLLRGQTAAAERFFQRRPRGVVFCG